ncbi:hypothetical protein [Kitasatospora paranensis]|uniref:Lipoprotein n=1 Tax=Kitasatospora paranensis TaxID=258053 RepID=A0ABW2FU81_9ACTN
MNASLIARHLTAAVVLLLTGAAATACGSIAADVRAGSRVDAGPRAGFSPALRGAVRG